VGGPDMAKEKGSSLGFPLKEDLYIISKCNNLKDNKFKAYLAGIFEGNGYILIKNFNPKKQYNPRFCITFNMKNEPLAKKLLELIGSGFIRYELQNNACILVVSSVIGLKKVVHLLNGELRTSKIDQFHSLVD
jgi:hypothetical protein